MSYIDKEFKVDGLTVELVQDEDASNPRHDCDNPAVMVCWHSRYDLGDEKEKWAQPWEGPQEFLAWAKEERIKFLPLYLYDHSGITMSAGSGSSGGNPFTCPWDSGMVGFIYWDPVEVKKCCGVEGLKWSRARIEKDMHAQVEEYDKYLTGDAWGYRVKDEEGEELDACWGYLGLEYAEQEARSAAKWQANHRKEETAKAARQEEDAERLVRECFAL